MKYLKLYTLSIVLIYSSIYAIAQEEEKKPFENITLNGYVSSMQSVMFDTLKNPWIIDNLVHNRLNFDWYGNMFSGSVQLRNRLIYGDQVKANAYNYKQEIDMDRGWIDMSWSYNDANSFLLNTNIDRAYLKFTQNNLEITAGRQRINWGQAFVWNPNDIFNAYSFIDFDYPERPGSDAVRLQYYMGYTSSIEAAIKVNSDDKITAAFLGKFNKWNYDFQLLGGIIDNSDWVGGLGWTGNIESVSFTGEASYIHPKENFSDTSGVFLLTIGGGYTFENSLYIQFEALYSHLDNSGISNFQDYYSQPLSVKNLAFTDYSIFSQITYPITPLLNGTFSAIYYPGLNGYFLGPSIDYSLGDNLSFSFFVQSFSGKFPAQGEEEAKKQTLNMGFLRFKYNF
jgi:hypothetical protein